MRLADAGLWAQWDDLVLKSMLRHVGDLPERTYLPVARMVSGDAAAVDAGWDGVVAQRRPVRAWDLPGVRWRNRYGNFVRELDWVVGVLREHLDDRDVESLVSDSIADGLRDWLAVPLAGLARLPVGAGKVGIPSFGDTAAAKAVVRVVAGRIMRTAGFLVGPMELSEDRTIEVPVCALHTVPGDAEPRAYEHACLFACKYACERVFSGDSPVHMSFDPHLPGLDCTLRLGSGAQPVRLVERPAPTPVAR